MACVQQHKILGIIVHENLSQKPHIATVCDKVTKVIGISSNSRRYLPSVTLKALYNSLFYLISTFVILSGHLHMPPTFKKKAIRIITFSLPRTRSKPLFSKLNILSLYWLYQFHVSCFLFSHLNHLLPASLSLLLHFNCDFHDYSTRSWFNLHKISLRYPFVISSQAPTIWNNIPLTVLNNLTTTNFKKNLKLYFLSLNWITTGFS